MLKVRDHRLSGKRKPTAYKHAWEIRDAYEYHEYDDAAWGRKFRTFLHGRAWTHAEGPVALFSQAVGWLRRHRVLLPGVSVPARKVSQVPPNRPAAPARYGLGSKAASLERAEEPKRTAMLTAVMRHLEAKAIVPMLGRDTRIARYALLVFDRVPSLHRPNREGS